MKVDVYYNLHKNVWSIRDRKTQKVVNHSHAVLFPNVVSFVVRQGGRDKVIREKKKNVHAFVRGINPVFHEIETVEDFIDANPHFMEITYNPYKHHYFYERNTGKRVDYAKDVAMIVLNNKGHVFGMRTK